MREAEHDNRLHLMPGPTPSALPHCLPESADPVTANNPLAAAARATRCGAQALQARDEGRTDFSAEFKAFISFAESQGLVGRTQLTHRTPDWVLGKEHDIWFDASSGRVFKATRPNAFGLRPGRNEEEILVGPGYYLERLVLQNEVFGDDIWLEGVELTAEGKVRVVTSQPFVEGHAATDEEIEAFFLANGFEKIVIDGITAWQEPARGLLVTDAHGDNILKTANGTLVPIDVNLSRQGQMPEGPFPT